MAIELSHDELLKDPYSVYSRLRRETPITPVEGHFLGSTIFVARYDDAVALLKDVRFSNEQRKVKTGRDLAKAWWIPSVLCAFLNSMVMVDDPDHTRLRTLVHKAFTPRMIQQMAQRIEEISNDLLDDAAKKPVVDLMADFALPLPLTVISELMGVPVKDRLKFHQWIGMFTETGPSGKLAALKIFRNAFAMQRFFKGLISSRRKKPQNDLITALVQAEEAGDRMSEDELVAMLFLVLFAGHETTVNLIGNGTLALLENPAQFEKLKANPALLDSAIEEMLRYTNPVQQVAPRYALQDVNMDGHVIPKGSTVMVGIASANRDETAFENADQFDITRDPNRHIAFGIGIHYCLGAPLARLEAKIAFQILFSRFPNIELAVPPGQLEWRASSALRGLESLPVRLKA